MGLYANIKTNVGEESLETCKDMPPWMNKADYIITYTSNPLLFFKRRTKQKFRRM